MRTLTCAMLLGASALALAVGTTAQAQTTAPAQAAPAAAEPETVTLKEIVVTARRKAESVQDVPQTVDAVQAATLQKLEIKEFSDVQALVPGLSLEANGTGYQAQASLRGVTFSVDTGAQPTVALYLNDAPVQANFLFQSLFDVGQIEVLKGPQGTTRGISAPSGAITVTTRKADLTEFGGYIDATDTDQHDRIIQGAINIPLINDVLALRVSAINDQNDFDGVHSINSTVEPRSLTNAERISLAFRPTSYLDANLTYEHLERNINSFNQVDGPGYGTSPAITAQQRESVQAAPNFARQQVDVLTGEIDGRFLGQRLAYIGSYQRFRINNNDPSDTGNIVPGVPLYQDTVSIQTQTTQEIRLSSTPSPNRFFDYNIGGFYNWQAVTGGATDVGALLPGVFGEPTNNFSIYNPHYVVPVNVNVPSNLQETSLYGNVTLHLWDHTELVAGLRHIWSIVDNDTLLTTGNAAAAVSASLFGGHCPTSFPASASYPGYCDFAVAGSTIENLKDRTSESPTIYNVSLSHHFGRDFLVYFTTGTSYRPPVASVGIFNASNASILNQLTFHPSETSTAYEIGEKWTFLGGRGRLNVSAYTQQYDNLTIYIPNINYLSNNGSGPTPTNFAFTTSVNARVQGIDAETAFQVTHDWSLSLQGSYNDGQIQGSQVPCNITNSSGQPVYNTQGVISMCKGSSASRLPLWNATLQTEYTHPVTAQMDGFVRGLLTYYPQNKNRVEPDFTVDDYSLLNIYAGLRSHDGGWEISLFAKNALQSNPVLDQSPTALANNSAFGSAFPQLIHPSGYYSALSTPRREIGINLHYAWGSR